MATTCLSSMDGSDEEAIKLATGGERGLWANGPEGTFVIHDKRANNSPPSAAKPQVRRFSAALEPRGQWRLGGGGAAAIVRHRGRSMRTFRSSRFLVDRADETVDLSDSAVDLCLRELAEKAPPPPAVGPELLDLSDSSSTASDLSDELERLASLGGGASGAAAATAEDSSPRFSGEAALPGDVERAVRAWAETMETPSSSAQSKSAAAAEIRQLAKDRPEFRELIGGCGGAVAALVGLLRSPDPAAQENAATALLNLSLAEPNRARITAAGAIKPLVYALRTGTVAAKQNAACALLALSMAEENRAVIGACGAIPALVSLLLRGCSRGKKDALTALYKLCSTGPNKERAVRAGAVRPLVELVAARGPGTAEKAMVVLASLAGGSEGRRAVLDEGAIPVLAQALEDSSALGKELAAAALLELCADGGAASASLARTGAVPALRALARCGSPAAKSKAEALLSCLRGEAAPPARRR
ncbi:uncharacterized protein LOC144702528 [Wolffia australiana]